jgi:DNA-binding MarR family transcriptional regulator
VPAAPIPSVGPLPNKPRESFASYLAYQLRRARILLGHLAAEMAPPGAGADISQDRELSILLVLSRCGPLSQHQLCERLTINRSVMVKLIDALEGAGLVVRQRSLTDRRSYALVLTDAAPQRLQALVAMFDRLNDRFTEPLSQQERQQLETLLVQLLEPQVSLSLPDELVRSPAFLVAAAQDHLEAFGDGVLSPFGLATRTYIALAIVASGIDGLTELSSHMMIGPAATVELVDGLEQRGCVCRLRDQADRRVLRLQLTEQGRELVATARQVVQSAADDFMVGVGLPGSPSHEELVGLLCKLTLPEVSGS